MRKCFIDHFVVVDQDQYVGKKEISPLPQEIRDIGIT